MSWVVGKRYSQEGYPRKLSALADCAITGDYQNCFTPLSEDGSPYDVYESNGDIKKALPLVYRPEFNVGFPGKEGEYIDRSEYSPYYERQCPQGMYLLDGRGPCVSREDCQIMGGLKCDYDYRYHNNQDSCFVKGCGKGIIKFRCPEPIIRTP